MMWSLFILLPLLVQSQGTPILHGTALYPRALIISENHLVASAVTFAANGAGVGSIFASVDGGKTLINIGNVTDPSGAFGLCCATLYRLPAAVGSFPIGTLLWAGSFASNHRPMLINVWASLDNGTNWRFVSTVVRGPSGNKGGLWEPEFTIDAKGRLICFYSDETDPRHSQRLYAKTTSDIYSWDSGFDVVSLPTFGRRPGMANVRKIDDGSYVMTYEICGVDGHLDCAAHIRKSPDGANWGNSQDPGTLIVGTRGEYFAHTPVLAWKEGNPGTAFVTAQMLFNSNGSPSSGSGGTIFYNKGMKSEWISAPAPVIVPRPNNNYCPNYSPALVAYSSGQSNQYCLFEISTAYSGPTCMAYYSSRCDNE